MKIRFLYPADIELEEIYHFYEKQREGLGDSFVDEFERCISTIAKNPAMCKKTGKQTRKALLKQFPVLILYVYEKGIIYITCIAHQHRGPEYYINRLI